MILHGCFAQFGQVLFRFPLADFEQGLAELFFVAEVFYYDAESGFAQDVAQAV